ncbi:MAG: hypothetical protein H6733_13015 [Alphaproteobacteria bacterium]|nr:hypothetical protein [Alphaproteobacteria bacterium]
MRHPRRLLFLVLLASACATGPTAAEQAAEARLACTFAPGDDAVTTLGVDAELPASIPIDHLVIVMNENRSFDHYLGRYGQDGAHDLDGLPSGWTVPGVDGGAVAPHHLDSPCLPVDPPHTWEAMHTSWNRGALDGFVTRGAIGGTDGTYAMGYYDEDDLPFYHWLVQTFATSDRYFSSVIGPTWPNRQYLYAGHSNGGKETGENLMGDQPTIFDALTERGVTWGVYTDGTPRQDSLGWGFGHEGHALFATFLTQLADGTLPQVAFVDPSGKQDEHPANDIHGGEAWAATLIAAAVASPLWPRLAVLYTYDEAGGLADHVPPPAACVPFPDQPAFDHLGFRVPFFVVSPWARPGFVSHAVHEHASMLRLVELLHGIPAFTARDANSDALLDLFDFESPPRLDPGPMPAAAPTVGCE